MSDQRKKEDEKSYESFEIDSLYSKYLKIFRKLMANLPLSLEEKEEYSKCVKTFKSYGFPCVKFKGRMLYLKPAFFYKTKIEMIFDLTGLDVYENPLTGRFYKMDSGSGKIKAIDIEKEIREGKLVEDERIHENDFKEEKPEELRRVVKILDKICEMLANNFL